MSERTPVRKKPTQFDVARLAGVSQTTVSLVLNNPETTSVPLDTREKVQDAIRSLGYMPNNAARVLRTSRTYTLACVIPMITNPFYPTFVSGIQAEAEACGYEVITYNTRNSKEKEFQIIQHLQQGRVDGVVGVFFHAHVRDLEPLFEKNIPVARLEVRKRTAGALPLDNLYVDNAAAAREATTYLVHRGCRRVAMVTGFLGPREARREGYLQALNEAGPGYQPLIAEVNQYDEIGGAEGMRQLMQDPGLCPDGIFAANDLMAIGAIKAAREAGLRVPEDIAVVGFDDIPAAALVTPALTTVRQFQLEMGQKAARLVLERLNGEVPQEGRVIEMPYELVVRESA
jgi:LacI family transcriptional regulator